MADNSVCIYKYIAPLQHNSSNNESIILNIQNVRDRWVIGYWFCSLLFYILINQHSKVTIYRMMAVHETIFNVIQSLMSVSLTDNT